jgi:hypothetical protein
MQSGQEKNCLRKRNGSLQQEEDQIEWISPGGTKIRNLRNPTANTWHGEFPYQNLLIDKYEGTSPVGAFLFDPGILTILIYFLDFG